MGLESIYLGVTRLRYPGFQRKEEALAFATIDFQRGLEFS